MHPLRETVHTEILSQSSPESPRQASCRTYVYLRNLSGNLSQPRTLHAHIRTAHQQPAAATRKRTATKTSDAPSAKRPKRSDQASTSTASEPTPMTSAENTNASRQPDPILIPANLVSSGEGDIAQMYRQHWPQIRTRFSPQNRLQD